MEVGTRRARNPRIYQGWMSRSQNACRDLCRSVGPNSYATGSIVMSDLPSAQPSSMCYCGPAGRLCTIEFAMNLRMARRRRETARRE